MRRRVCRKDVKGDDEEEDEEKKLRTGKGKLEEKEDT